MIVLANGFKRDQRLSRQDRAQGRQEIQARIDIGAGEKNGSGERREAKNESAKKYPMNFWGLIGAALSIIGVVVGLAGVKAGASLMVLLGIALLVVGLVIVDWSRE